MERACLVLAWQLEIRVKYGGSLRDNWTTSWVMKPTFQRCPAIRMNYVSICWNDEERTKQNVDVEKTQSGGDYIGKQVNFDDSYIMKVATPPERWGVKLLRLKDQKAGSDDWPRPFTVVDGRSRSSMQATFPPLVPEPGYRKLVTKWIWASCGLSGRRPILLTTFSTWQLCCIWRRLCEPKAGGTKLCLFTQVCF